MKKFIVGFFSILLFLVVALAIFIFTFDINTYKSKIEKALSEASGYTFVINGNVKATRSLETTVVITDVNIKASKGYENQSLIHAATATIELDLKSLMKDTIVIHSVELADVDVTLKVNEEGVVNWLPTNASKKGGNAARPALKKPLPKEEGKKEINIATIKAKKVNVTYENKQANSTFAITFPQLEIQQLLNFSGKANFRKETIGFSGTIRNLATVLKNQRNLNFSFDINSDLGKGKISGVCRDLTACRDDFTLNINFSGKNLSKMYTFIMQEDRPLSTLSFETQSKIRLLKETMLAEGVFSLGKNTLNLSYNVEQNAENKSGKGRIELDVNDASLSKKYGLSPFSVKTNYTSYQGKIFDFSNIASMFNETDIDGVLRVDLTNKIPNLTADLHSHYFKLANILYSEKEAGQEKQKQKNTDKVFSDQPIEWSVLNTFNGTASIVIDNLSVANMLSRYPQVLLKAKLSDGLLTVDLREGSYFAGGQIVGNAVVKTQGKDARVSVSAVAEGLEFAQVVPWKKVLRSGSVNGNVLLTTTGNSIASLLGNLSGNVLFSLNQVDITSPIIAHLSTENATAMSKASQELVIKCGVINTKINDGVIQLLKNVAFETSKFNMIIDGTVNLKDEELSLHLLPQANKTDKLSRITQGVAFEGPFTNPKSRVFEQESSPTQPTKTETVVMSEKQAFLDSYTRKAPAEDTTSSVCRAAMGSSILKDIDAYFGRQKAVVQEEKVAPAKETEEVSKAQMIGRGLLDSLSDALSNEQKPATK